MYVSLWEYYVSQLHIDWCVLELEGSYEDEDMDDGILQRDLGFGVGGEER